LRITEQPIHLVARWHFSNHKNEYKNWRDLGMGDTRRLDKAPRSKLEHSRQICN
jgi:hypothetical protein